MMTTKTCQIWTKMKFRDSTINLSRGPTPHKPQMSRIASWTSLKLAIKTSTKKTSSIKKTSTFTEVSSIFMPQTSKRRSRTSTTPLRSCTLTSNSTQGLNSRAPQTWPRQSSNHSIARRLTYQMWACARLIFMSSPITL